MTDQFRLSYHPLWASVWGTASSLSNSCRSPVWVGPQFRYNFKGAGTPCQKRYRVHLLLQNQAVAPTQAPYAKTPRFSVDLKIRANLNHSQLNFNAVQSLNFNKVGDIWKRISLKTNLSSVKCRFRWHILTSIIMGYQKNVSYPITKFKYKQAWLGYKQAAKWLKLRGKI